MTIVINMFVVGLCVLTVIGSFVLNIVKINKIKEGEQEEEKSLKQAIAENTRKLERVWSNQGPEGELVREIKLERARLQERLRSFD